MNMTNLLADLENVCTAFFDLKKNGHIPEALYQKINGQIYDMETIAHSLKEVVE